MFNLQRLRIRGAFFFFLRCTQEKNEFLVMDVFAPGTERPLVPGPTLDIGTTTVAVLFDECIFPLVHELASEAGIETSQIYRAAAAANTTMAQRARLL